MSKIRVGIDPGKESYICVWREEEGFEFFQLPTVGKETDINGVAKLFSTIAETITVDDDYHAVIESVHAIYGSSASNTFEFGKMLGVLEGLLCAYRIPYTKVQPKTWQKEMWQGVSLQTKKSSTGKTQINDTKAMSEVAAKRLFPTIDLRKNERCKIADHNKVDALLLCEYAKRKF